MDKSSLPASLRVSMTDSVGPKNAQKIGTIQLSHASERQSSIGGDGGDIMKSRGCY